MPNKNYNSGRQFEYRVKKYLEKKGYYVMRSAGSKSPFDLVAVPQSGANVSSCILLVQCKHGTKISKKEKERLLELDVIFPTTIFVLIAWSKPNGQLKFEEVYAGKWYMVKWL